jgi:hypothetical protein
MRSLRVVVVLVALAAALGAVWSSRTEQEPAPARLSAEPRVHVHVIAAAAAVAASSRTLPAAALRGNEYRLREYPVVRLATARQRARAERLLTAIRASARRWPTPRAAAVAGFDTRPARRARPLRVGYLHAEHRRYSADRHYLDPRRPEALIYANVPGRPLELVGMMFSVPRGVHGATPGGPITRWHTHRVCVRGNKRGLAPLAGGRCVAGARMREGSEMLHVWFTHDLRSAFAIHAPERELCVARLLPASVCATAAHGT